MAGKWTDSRVRHAMQQRSQRLLWKIVLPFAGGGILLLTVGVLAAGYVIHLQNASAELLEWNVSSIRAAEELEIVIRETRYRLNQYLLTGDPHHLHEVRHLRETTEFWIAEAERLATTVEEEQLLHQVREGYRRFLEARSRLTDNVDLEVVRQMARDILPNDVLRPARLYLDLNEQHLSRSTDESRAVADRLVIGLLLLGLCGAVAGLVAGYGLARGVSRSILQLSVPVGDVAGQLEAVVGQVSVSAEPPLDDLEQILQLVSERVSTVIEQLQESQRTALRTEQLASLGQFAAGLAHELRNPLMSMKILIQAALEDVGEARLTGRDLMVLEEEIRRLEQLVQGFLDFARPPEAIRQTVSLIDVIAPAVSLLSAQAARRDVHVGTSVDAALPPVEGDPGQLRQVVLNLVLNAIDATPPGGRVDIYATEQNGVAVIRVEDTGCGLPDELGESIFDPFVSTRETGIGLGLSICRRIVETHQGSMSAKTRPQGGAELTFTVPLARSVASAS